MGLTWSAERSRMRGDQPKDPARGHDLFSRGLQLSQAVKDSQWSTVLELAPKLERDTLDHGHKRAHPYLPGSIEYQSAPAEVRGAMGRLHEAARIAARRSKPR